MTSPSEAQRFPSRQSQAIEAWAPLVCGHGRAAPGGVWDAQRFRAVLGEREEEGRFPFYCRLETERSHRARLYRSPYCAARARALHGDMGAGLRFHHMTAPINRAAARMTHRPFDIPSVDNKHFQQQPTSQRRQTQHPALPQGARAATERLREAVAPNHCDVPVASARGGRQEPHGRFPPATHPRPTEDPFY